MNGTSLVVKKREVKSEGLNLLVDVITHPDVGEWKSIFYDIQSVPLQPRHSRTESLFYALI